MDRKKIEKLIWDICIRIFIYFGASIPILMAQKEYFQQHVSYEIDVKLNDQDHTLSAFEKIKYTNNSPDSLDRIYMHLYPNAFQLGSVKYREYLGNSGRASRAKYFKKLKLFFQFSSSISDHLEKIQN